MKRFFEKYWEIMQRRGPRVTRLMVATSISVVVGTVILLFVDFGGRTTDTERGDVGTARTEQARMDSARGYQSAPSLFYWRFIPLEPWNRIEIIAPPGIYHAYAVGDSVPLMCFMSSKQHWNEQSVLRFVCYMAGVIKPPENTVLELVRTDGLNVKREVK